MKKVTESMATANTTLLVAFADAIRSDLSRAMQPLHALRPGWRNDGISGAGRAFMRAQRDNFPQGLFSLLLLAQSLVLGLLLIAITVTSALAWGGIIR